MPPAQVFGPYVPLVPGRGYTAQFQVRASALARMTVTWLRDSDYAVFGTTGFQVDTVFKDFRCACTYKVQMCDLIPANWLGCCWRSGPVRRLTSVPPLSCSCPPPRTARGMQAVQPVSPWARQLAPPV